MRFRITLLHVSTGREIFFVREYDSWNGVAESIEDGFAKDVDVSRFELDDSFYLVPGDLLRGCTVSIREE